MANSLSEFAISDDETFDQNVEKFAQLLRGVDATLGPVLEAHLSKLVDGTNSNLEIWNALLAAVDEEKKP